ncbi:hypothetical protein CFN58_28425 [Pseudomonas avellanae]|uniref:Uncharacterized protein n=2 Tax=Pseudomonas syringae group TaxID=136849 RepID=A0A261WD69_9PSED|nr:hypothetical protein [Pseudomonas syringae]ATV18019.1 hypothetical protein CT122_15055 [Pseudomonas syringae pv. actinidiae]OZI83882.1 hypothetical protein CFN58_28425 [Pseudomonas avellanae]PIN61521.1 hypothetical protein CUB86_10745 [Pseudomonas syringae pv. actinidiae]GAO92432.1 hypothetical protein PSA5_06965 [Pseudomonas syringae pv. actinidiae]
MLSKLGSNDIRKIEDLFLMAVDNRQTPLSSKAAQTQIKTLTTRLRSEGSLQNNDLITHFNDMISDPAIESLARKKSARKVIEAADHTGTSLAGNSEVFELYLI